MLSSANSFSKQPERTNPGVSSGIWLVAFIALPVGLLLPAWLRLGDCCLWPLRGLRRHL